MADNGDTAEQKQNLAKPEGTESEACSPDKHREQDEDASKTKFINGGNSLEDTTVDIGPAVSDASFTGLGKEELKKFQDDPFWVKVRWTLLLVFWVGWGFMLLCAVLIIIIAPRCPDRPDLKWYHKEAIYNIYTKSFFDGRETQDGYGDLKGIEKKEKYIDSLNVNAIWLSSVLKTEDNNDRAVLDYMALDERFGSVESLSAFCRKRSKDGKKVVMDLVPNQTSRNHTWFVKSQKWEGKYADYYIWADQVGGMEPNTWERADKSGKMWVWDSVRKQYYLSQFDGTADLNLTNEDVIKEFKRIIEFWTEQGVSGFHINDIEHLTENPDISASDVAETETKNYEHNAFVVDALRRIMDGLDNKPGREKLLFGTVSTANTEQLQMYGGGGKGGLRGLHVVSVLLEGLTPLVNVHDLQHSLEPFILGSTTHWMGWRLSSSRPGSTRAFNRVGEERMVIAHALQALLPGSPLPYYGDEIAMQDGTNQVLLRTVTPMQWSKEANAGFTKGTPWTPVSSSYTTNNVESKTAQLGDHVMMKAFRSLTQLSSTKESLQFGKTLFCSAGELLIFGRHALGFESFLVVANLGPATGHTLAGTPCAHKRKEAQLVFHSHHPEHQGTSVKLDQAVHIGENEVLVFEMVAEKPESFGSQ